MSQRCLLHTYRCPSVFDLLFVTLVLFGLNLTGFGRENDSCMRDLVQSCKSYTCRKSTYVALAQSVPR